jgi:2-polyprenyl-6-methoxyphenol hydroxylase-like FAD-dependent oxidoreductase
MHEQVDVLIIGAGPVGLTLANELKRRDVAVRIVEKRAAIREISKALIWHVRTQEALDKVGILERGLAEAQPLKEVVMRAYGKRIGSWLFAGIDSPNPHAAVIGQNRTQHLLLDVLRERGGDVEWNSTVTAVAPDDDGVTVTVEPAAAGSTARATIRAKYVVGCEGSNSVVRKTLGLTFEGQRYSGEQFIQADCKIRWTLPGGRSYLFLTDDGYLMVIEMPGGMVRIFISLPDRDGEGEARAASDLGAVEDISAEPTLADIHSNFVRLTGIDVELSDATWLARYRTSHRYANTFGVGRCFVAGDAGHVHVPIGGQGMNTGIQDAFNLGWKLAGVVRGDYRRELLDTYSAERHPVAQALIAGTDRSYRGVLHPSELQQRLVRMFGPFIVRTQLVQETMATVLEELNIAYDASPLNADLKGTAGPKPGHRAPLSAAVVRWPDCRTVTLAQVTRTIEWALLVFGGDSEHRGAQALRPEPLPQALLAFVTPLYVTTSTAAPDLAGYEILIDGEEHLHRSYGVMQPAFYLLRPDGIVAMRGPAFDLTALTSYFSETLGVRARNEATA